MPQIIVVADPTEAPAVIFRERVNQVVFESDHAASQLLERLEWAVSDAHAVERDRASHSDAPPPHEGEVDYEDAAPRSARVLTTAS